jgi:membrane-associated phospholipid phosphatase
MSFDEEWFRLINGWAGQFPAMDWFMFHCSQESHLLFPGILAVAYWGWTRWAEAKLAAPGLALLLGLSDLIGGQMKLLIGRARPCQVLAHIQELVGCGGTFSMPSNHAVNSSTAVAFLVVLYPSLGWVLWPFMALIGLSRVYLGGHYVTDVLVGWVIGLILGGGVAFFIKKKIFKR